MSWQGINPWTWFGHTGTSVSNLLQDQTPEITGFWEDISKENGARGKWTKAILLDSLHMYFIYLSRFIWEIWFIYSVIYCFMSDRRGMISTNWQQPQKMESKSPKEGKRTKRTWMNWRKKWSWYDIFLQIHTFIHKCFFYFVTFWLDLCWDLLCLPCIFKLGAICPSSNSYSYKKEKCFFFFISTFCSIHYALLSALLHDALHTWSIR